MSRRNYSSSPLRFTDRREVRDSVRHDNRDFGRHGNDHRAREYDRDARLRDDRNRDTIPRDEHALDRHGQYHQAILREDILDPVGADLVLDRYDDRGYEAGNYQDRRQHYDDLHPDSYGERTFVEDSYTVDTYETHHSYQVDRYNRNDSEVRYADHGDRNYDDNYRSDVNTNNDAYHERQDEGHSRSYDRDRDRLDDSRIVNERFKVTDIHHHAVSEDFTNARDNRVSRESRDINRNNVRRGGQTHDRFGGSSNKFPQSSRVMDTSNKQKKPKETTVHCRYNKQLSGQKHGDARIIRKGDLHPDSKLNCRGATNKTNRTDSFDKMKASSRIGEKAIKGSDSKTSGVSKASDKTTKIDQSEKQSNITSSKKDAEKVGNRDIKVTQTDKATTKTTNSRSGQSDHSNRSRERTLKKEPERKQNTSSGDRRERKNAESARESSSRSNVAKGSYESDRRVSRQRSSGGGVENKDEGVYHDDDVLSILADDDRFDRETRGMSDFSSRKEGNRDNRPSQRDNRKQSGDRFASRSDNSGLQKQSGDVRSKTDFRSDRPLKQSYTARTNNWNNNRQFGKSGFYRKKTGFSTQFSSHGKGRFSKFVGERAKETRCSEADSKFGRKQSSYVNQESNKTWNHEAVGKKSVFNRGNGKVSSTIRNNYKSNRGFGYKSRVMGKPVGFKNDSSRQNYLDNGSKRKGRDDYVDQNRSDIASRQQLDSTDNIGYMEGEPGREGNFNDSFVRNFDRNVDLSEQGQQIIFIPNADYPGNVDSYGNVITTDQGGISQVPYQMLPSNMAPSDNPQGSEQLIFIPFVNNQLQADSAVPVQLNSDGQIQMPEFKQEDDKSKKGMDVQRKLIGKGLSAKKRALLRKKLIAKRRQRLEKEIEKKVLKKLLGNSGNSNLASNIIKKGIKRISPPARGTGKPRSRRQAGLEDVSDEYDDVSDLESVSEEEDGNPRRRGGQRKAFRKPGEPRVNQASTIQSGQDVRRVVEKNAENIENEDDDSRGIQRGKKRTVYEVHDNQGSVKFMKTNERKYERGSSTGRQDLRGHKSMSPLQITVNNDKFSSSGNRNKGKGPDAREKIDARANRGQEGRYANIKSNPRGNSQDSADRDDNENDESNWKKGKYMDNENTHGRRKKQLGNDNGHSKINSEESWNERRRNQPKHWSDDGERPNSSQSQSFTMKEKQGIQQGLFVSNQGLINQSQSLSTLQPYQQSVLASQTQQLAGSLQPNISLVTGGSSIDPSLPPVMNIPQLSQSNLMLHPDMSLPPPQVSMIGSQNSLSQLAYQPALPSQAVLSLQNQLLQSNHQLQQATLQQQQQQLMQLQQQALLGNRNQLDNSTAIINNSGGLLNNSGLGQPLLSNIQQNTSRGLSNSSVSIQGSDRVLQNRGGSLFQDNSGGTSTLNLNNQQSNQQAGIQDQQLLQNQGSQQQSLDSQQNLGPQIQLGHMQTPKSIVTTLQHSSSNLSLNSGHVNSLSQLSAGTRHQEVRGVLGTIAKGAGSAHQNSSIGKSAQNKPLVGSYRGPMNEAGQGIGAHFKGQQFYPKGSSNYSYDNKGNTSNSFSNKSRFDSPINKSSQVVNNDQYGKYDQQNSGGRSTGNHNRYDQGRTTSQDRYDHGNQHRWNNKDRNELGRSTNQENTFQGRATNQNRSFQGRSANPNRYEQENQTYQDQFTQGRPANQDRFAHSRVDNQGSRPEGYQINLVESDEESDDDDVGQLLCTKCDKVYLSKRVMRKHGLWHDRSASGQFDLSCDRCELAFLTVAALNSHIDEKHKLEAWNCQYCDLSFAYSSALLRHLQRDNHFSLRMMFVCPTCPEQFGSVKLLSHHKQTHTRRTVGYRSSQ